MVIPPYKVLLDQHNPGFTELVLALDPGETTGWCLFKGTTILEHGQIRTKDVVTGGQAVYDLLAKYGPAHLVMENYRIYAHKLKEHAGSEVHTVQFIGAIKVIANLHKLKPSLQMAVQAKQFCTDEKLKAWDVWYKGEKHARDAIRHAMFYMLFTHPKEVKAQLEKERKQGK